MPESYGFLAVLPAHAHADSVDLHIFHGNHQAFAAVDDPGFYQFYFFWLYVDHHIWGFDLKFASVGNVGGYHGGFFASNHLILVIEGFQLFILYAAILKKALHLGLGKNYRVWRILLGFDDLVQFLMDKKIGKPDTRPLREASMLFSIFAAVSCMAMWPS